MERRVGPTGTGGVGDRVPDRSDTLERSGRIQNRKRGRGLVPRRDEPDRETRTENRNVGSDPRVLRSLSGSLKRSRILRWFRIIPSVLHRRYRIPSPLYHPPGHTGALRRYGERDPRGLRALRFLVILEGWIPLRSLRSWDLRGTRPRARPNATAVRS